MTSKNSPPILPPSKSNALSNYQTRTYSLVEQNSVASLVEAKPEERRQFIEEAAGISKYKSRKESAVRKMEATQQNLLRLNDIIREVKAQLGSISRQAKKAEQYKALKLAVKEAELTVALQSYADLSTRRITREEEKNALTASDGRKGKSVGVCTRKREGTLVFEREIASINGAIALR